MNFKEYLKLAFRNRYLITIITVLCLFVSYFIFTQQNKSNLENTLFISFSIQNQQPSNTNYSPYENLQAADQITESIQGWMITPAFQAELNQLSKLNYSAKVKKQEKNNLLINYSSDTSENAVTYQNQLIQSLQKRLTQYNQQSDLKINLAFSDLKTDSKSTNPVLYLFLGLIVGLVLSYCFAFGGELLTNRIQSTQTIYQIFNKNPLDNYSNKADLVKHHEYLSRLINSHLKGNELQILDQTSKKRFAIELISKFTNYNQIKSHFFPKDIENIKTNKPTLLMVELGYTKINKLERIKNLNFETLEILVIDRLSKLS